MNDEKTTLRERYTSITGTINTIQSAVSLVKDFRGKYNEKFLYTAVLDETSFVYVDIMEYINAKTRTRNFKFLSTREGIWRFYDSESTAVFYIGEHKIRAALRKPGPRVKSGDEFGEAMAAMASVNKKNELTFTCSTSEGLNAVEKLLKDFTDAKQRTKRSNYIVNPDKWGDWDYEDLPEKSMDSVFLPRGVKEDLLNDFENFRAREDRFKAVGIPYHRGYAFYGEPGNGKSSIALGLANYFNMDLFNLPLSTVKEDKDLNKCIAGLRKNSLLLLEDIDIFSSTMNREGDPGTPTLAGLLNALDGVNTPHGLITIITTNFFDKLDPALIRPGRVDYRLELKKPVQSQIEDMFYRVFEEPLGLDTKPFDSMAQVADVFKRSLDDPEAVRIELKNDD